MAFVVRSETYTFTPPSSAYRCSIIERTDFALSDSGTSMFDRSSRVNTYSRSFLPDRFVLTLLSISIMLIVRTIRHISRSVDLTPYTFIAVPSGIYSGSTRLCAKGLPTFWRKSRTSRYQGGECVDRRGDGGSIATRPRIRDALFGQ